ncbi:hypothetical protein QOZ83_16235 [Romboutsia sedimentorum]|uniref:hypothetical protein n=1 Tax=Romboutsia sedimentorum TaxID=1368474 RepID=UPI0024DE4DDD|nr:hypothetical protein [Romboutsia sedimentorum]MDK2587394.1 hypothetical protein [Romboutsia sedimentorum]
MKNEKLTISAIADKLEIQEVEVQADPCKDHTWAGVYDCYIDCDPIVKGGPRTPKGSPAY